MSSRALVKKIPPAGLNSRDVESLQSSVRDTERFVEARKDRITEGPLDRIVGTAEVFAGAFGVGFVSGLTGSSSVGPVPIGLGVAAIYYAAEAFGYVPGRYATHLEKVLGKGALAGYGAMLGAGQGYLMRQRSEAKRAANEKPPAPPAAFAGAPASIGAPKHDPVGARLTEAEYQAIAQHQARRHGR